ncbi:uncharacterized protein plppr3b isoform X2 [Syngnathus typhle]|uniref:uncharacterized protein plppr3b isoform X2 n=1 Tax=Syngnathus typhle TaxID=161592 RepID=UPI002A698FF8|nr:uncharacterized protein plppr3b isoform X2 [Syngnathus typhle]
MAGVEAEIRTLQAGYETERRKRLPFGISSTPEIFQRKMAERLQGLEGAEVYMADILVHGETEEEHDKRLEQVLRVVEEAGLKLNRGKCKFRRRQIKFLGHIIDENGVRPDPAKVEGIEKFPKPQNVAELRRFIGMVNYLAKFVPEMATVGQPLYELLKTSVRWQWGPAQESSFRRLKSALASAPVLTFYDANKPTMVSADASTYGLGGVLLQRHGEDWRPMAYCSRRLRDPETRYAQIEKECLASVWACERFEKYLIGLETFTLVTDHKPLVPLMNNKDLDNVPLRCQRLLMRLMRFNAETVYAPGKTLAVADALSRGPLEQTGDEQLEEDVMVHIGAVINHLPATPHKLQQIREHTDLDPQLQLVKQFIQKGWAGYERQVPEAVKDFYKVRGELSVVEGLVVRGSQIVIPSVMRSEMIDRIHDGHQGLVKCRERAKQSVWWPGISKCINNKVTECDFCTATRHTQNKETLIPAVLPDRPWQKIGVDLCEYNKQNYLVASDYYSRYLEILNLPTTTTTQVISKLAATFARFGVPEELVSDNGPQFTSEEFRRFSRELDFIHTTSSPHYAQSNGHSERAVQIAKGILKQENPLLALMVYRSTPTTSTGCSPAELLMGRKIRTTLPILSANLDPRWPNREETRSTDAAAKQKQAFYYDRRNGVRHLPPLSSGDNVLMKLDNEKRWATPGMVQGNSSAPRSYVVTTAQGGCFRRNRHHLLKVPAAPLLPAISGPPQDLSPKSGDDDIIATSETSPMTETVTITRSGRVSKPPPKLDL